MSSRLRLGGTSTQPAATREDTPRDLQILHGEYPPDDREFSALIFAGICAGPLIIASIVLFYLVS